MDNQPTLITFNITYDDSPIIIGMVVKIHTVTDNLTSPPSPFIFIKRSTDNGVCKLETYMSVRDPFKAILWFPVVPICGTEALFTRGILTEAIPDACYDHLKAHI